MDLNYSYLSFKQFLIYYKKPAYMNTALFSPCLRYQVRTFQLAPLLKVSSYTPLSLLQLKVTFTDGDGYKRYITSQKYLYESFHFPTKYISVIFTTLYCRDLTRNCCISLRRSERDQDSQTGLTLETC
jgi:hypothetical protein